MKYRLYVDEVGNSDLEASEHPNHRYLSLTGIMVELSYVESVLFPALEQLKRRFFASHPDDPVVLHRKELVNKKPPFQSLLDPVVEAAFNRDILNLLATLDYIVFTVVIDKLEQKTRYTTWRYDPYHYCLAVLVERYVRCLERKGAMGDVMAESRGGKEDTRLKRSFERIYSDGTEFVAPALIQAQLTSKQLKVKLKSANIAGLQLADLIAHPSYRAVCCYHSRQALSDNFGGKIAAILEQSKYYRSPSGRIEGWGRKWLP